MSYEREVLRRAMTRLEEQRKDHAAAEEVRRRAICEQIPQLTQVERELGRTIAGIVAASLRDGTGPAPALGEVRARNLELQARRAALLEEGGYDPDALDQRPLCPACGDTGWQGAAMCHCLRALCAQEQIRTLSSLIDLGGQCFDSFSMDWYSERLWPGEGRSPRENMEFIYDVCFDYARKFGRFYFKNLLLTGPPGLGKTFLSACIARTVSEQGFSVVYDTAADIFAKFETRKFARDEEEIRGAAEEIRRYLGCDLLLVDDLGSELTTPFVQSALYQVINGRLTAGRNTVISTNLSMEEVRRRYTGQTASRMEGEYRVLPFFGEDIRLLRKQRL